MDVFVSWSGETSLAIARQLRNWMPKIIKNIRPFVSSSDIPVGDRWCDVLAQELAKTSVGIVCITSFNLKAPWLSFESGALTKPIQDSSVIPFLFKVDRSKVQGPLAQFQSIIYNKDGVLELLQAINNHLPSEYRMTPEDIGTVFNQNWPELKAQLDAIEDELTAETETGYPWLYSSTDLARNERDNTYRSIWVVTPSPYDDLHLDCVLETLKKIIARGAEYIFIMPKSDTLDEAETALKGLFAKHPEQLVVYEISRNEFTRSAVTHYLIMNPEPGEHFTPRVFLELPISQRGLWIETSSEAAVSFKARFQDLIKNKEPKVFARTALPCQVATAPPITVAPQ